MLALLFKFLLCLLLPLLPLLLLPPEEDVDWPEEAAGSSSPIHPSVEFPQWIRVSTCSSFFVFLLLPLLVDAAAGSAQHTTKPTEFRVEIEVRWADETWPPSGHGRLATKAAIAAPNLFHTLGYFRPIWGVSDSSPAKTYNRAGCVFDLVGYVFNLVGFLAVCLIFGVSPPHASIASHLETDFMDIGTRMINGGGSSFSFSLWSITPMCQASLHPREKLSVLSVSTADPRWTFIHRSPLTHW